MKTEKVVRLDTDKSESIKLEFLMNPDNPASKCSQQFDIFKNGCPEEWIKWVMASRKIESLMLMKEPADKTKIFRNLLRVKPYVTLSISQVGE
jgi:hypothetical protein